LGFVSKKIGIERPIRLKNGGSGMIGAVYPVTRIDERDGGIDEASTPLGNIGSINSSF